MCLSPPGQRFFSTSLRRSRVVAPVYGKKETPHAGLEPATTFNVIINVITRLRVVRVTLNVNALYHCVDFLGQLD